MLILPRGEKVNAVLYDLLKEFCATNYRDIVSKSDDHVAFVENRIHQQYFVHLVFRLHGTVDLGGKDEQELINLCLSKFGSVLTYDEYKFLWLLNAFSEYVRKLTCNARIEQFNCSDDTSIHLKTAYAGYLRANNFYVDLLLATLYIFAKASENGAYSNYINSDTMKAVMAADIEDNNANIFTMNREVTTTDYTDNSYIGYHTPFLYDVAQYTSAYDELCTLI